MLPFVPGCQCQCLVYGRAFGSQQLWTSGLGSFWMVLQGQPGLRLEECQPGKDHCFAGLGEACL